MQLSLPVYSNPCDRLLRGMHTRVTKVHTSVSRPEAARAGAARSRRSTRELAVRQLHPLARKRARIARVDDFLDAEQVR